MTTVGKRANHDFAIALARCHFPVDAETYDARYFRTKLNAARTRTRPTGSPNTMRSDGTSTAATPKISVIISVFNGEPHVSASIDSILRQTYDDFELILVDDGSTDRSGEIIAAYAGRDSRVIPLTNARNLGLTRSLNQGLARARGELIARQDADDIALSGRFARQVSYLDAQPQVGVVGTGIEIIGDQDRRIRELVRPNDHAVLAALLLMNSCLPHPTLMIRRQLLQDVGGYDEQYRYAQDYDLCHRLSKRTQLAALPEVLLRYRMGQNLSVRHRADQAATAFRISLDVLETAGAPAFDVGAYRRFWYACFEPPARLRRGDIGRIVALLDFIVTRPGAQQAWGLRFEALSQRLLSCGNTWDGFNLARIVARASGRSVISEDLLKDLLRPYLPGWMRQVWRRIRP